jgi:hypothetical protein
MIGHRHLAAKKDRWPYFEVLKPLAILGTLVKKKQNCAWTVYFQNISWLAALLPINVWRTGIE